MNTFQSNTFPGSPSYMAHFMPPPYNLAPSMTLTPQTVSLTLSHHYHGSHQQANYQTHHQQGSQHPPSSTVSNRPTPNLSRRFSSNSQNGGNHVPNSTLPQRRPYYVNSSSSTSSNSSNSSSNSNSGNNYKQVMMNGTNGNHVMSNGDPKAATDSTSTC